MQSVNAAEMDVLRHTARNRRYNGTTPEIESLVAKGLMRNIGRPDWVPDDYFALTEAGRELLAAFNDPAYLKIEVR